MIYSFSWNWEDSNDVRLTRELFPVPISVSMHRHLANWVIGRRPFATSGKAFLTQSERHHMYTSTTRRDIRIKHLRSGAALPDSSQSSVMPFLRKYRTFDGDSLQRIYYPLRMTGSN